MIGLNRREKEKLVLDLYESGSNYREIAKEARISLRDIKGILDKANGVKSSSKSSQAYHMFSDGKSPMEVAIALDMREPEVIQLYKESWALKQIYDLNSIYLETKGDLASFVKLYELSKKDGLNANHVVRILRLADDDLLHLEARYHNLRSEVESLDAKKESLIRIMQDYDNQIGALSKFFDNYCQLCQEVEEKLTLLQRKRLETESLLSHSEDNNKENLRIRNVIEEKVHPILANGATLLKLAISFVLQSIKCDPEQYMSLIRNNFSSANYKVPTYPVHINNHVIQDYETMLANNAAKLYSELVKNLVDEILYRYDIGTSPYSLPLITPSD